MSRVSTSCACGIGAVTRRIGSSAKNTRAFRHGMDVAGEAKVGEVRSSNPSPNRPRAREPVDLVGGEAQVLEEVERLFEAGGHQEAAPRRQPADEEFEHRRLGLAMVQVGLDHVELVEVGQQRQFLGHVTLLRR